METDTANGNLTTTELKKDTGEVECPLKELSDLGIYRIEQVLQFAEEPLKMEVWPASSKIMELGIANLTAETQLLLLESQATGLHRLSFSCDKQGEFVHSFSHEMDPANPKKLFIKVETDEKYLEASATKAFFISLPNHQFKKELFVSIEVSKAKQDISSALH